MENIVFIKSGKSLFKLNIHEIIAVQGLGNYVQIYTCTEEKHIYYNKLDSLLDKLPNNFMRVHISFIINFNYIEKVQDNHIFIKNLRIPIGPSKRNCFKKRIEQYKL